jgi:cellulose synthase operon protein C
VSRASRALLPSIARRIRLAQTFGVRQLAAAFPQASLLAAWRGGGREQARVTKAAASCRTPKACAGLGLPGIILGSVEIVVGLAGIIALAVGSLAYAATPEGCRSLRKRGRNAEAQKCFEALTQTRDPYLRAEGYWGLEEYDEANDQFRIAVAQSDQNANYRVRWGLLLHERFNNTDAENLFKEALQRDSRNAQAYLGLALVSADGFDSRALEWTAKAITLDPKLVEAHELMASLALEDSDTQQALAQADQALKLSPEALDAMAIHAAVEVLADRTPDAWLEKIRQVNPTYGEGWALIAHHLVLNYRWEDAVTYYRQAVALDPDLWSAHSDLGVNLMRLGQDQEARRQLEMCYDHGYRNEATVNSLRLLDSYQNFVTFNEPGIVLKLQKKEADLLRPYFEEQVRQNIADYEKKYKMTLPGPVQVEVYPDHEDFAVRTMGMPGLGALGVTFGEVVAMDSPSSREPGSFNWASTLRHEMSHVFILTATNHRVPRWFTEGLAVHEETEASPEWGDRVTPEVLVAIRDKKLLPVTDLDRGFVRPDYPGQVIVSYFQAGRICDYIKSRWGDDKLLEMVHSFAGHKTTAGVVQQDLGMKTDEFDHQFQDWLNHDLGKTAANFDEWRKRLRDLAELAKSGQYDQVLKQGDEVLHLYPEYVFEANAYQFMADADLAKGNDRAAAALLTSYEKMGGSNPESLKELASLEEKLGEPQDAASTLDRINYIYPMDEGLHRHLGELWLGQKNFDGAVREYSAVVAMRPLDTASAQFNLAEAYFAEGRNQDAEEHILASLESAPGFRPAQKLLLQIEDAGKGTH